MAEGIETVPAIRGRRARPALDSEAVWHGLDGLPDELVDRCRTRLKAGAERYGLSWNEVDLKQDILEELEDAINYTTFIIARLADQEILNEDLTEITGRLRFHAYAAWELANSLPDFEGPTSNQWVEQRKAEAVAVAPI